jgi:hypothetical protein
VQRGVIGQPQIAAKPHQAGGVFGLHHRR